MHTRNGWISVCAAINNYTVSNTGDKDKQSAPRQLDTRQLLGRDREIYILHNNERYILRITANNKLILTK